MRWIYQMDVSDRWTRVKVRISLTSSGAEIKSLAGTAVTVP